MNTCILAEVPRELSYKKKVKMKKNIHHRKSKLEGLWLEEIVLQERC